MADKILFIDCTTTSNTAGDGHDCPVDFTFNVIDADKPDDIGQIKQIRMVPDEKIMPGARVYSHFPAEISDGNDLKKGMMMVKTLLKRATESGMYVVSFDIDFVLKAVRNTMERVLQNPDGMIDTDEFFEIPYDKQISVRNFAKIVLPPEEVGTSYSFEALYLHLCGDDKYSEARKDFDSGVSSRSVYNQVMTLGIFRKLCERKGFATCQEVNDFVTSELGKKFGFGKYAGQKVEDVFAKDFGYCLWCFKNAELMEGNPALQKELVRLMKQKRKA